MASRSPSLMLPRSSPRAWPGGSRVAAFSSLFIALAAAPLLGCGSLPKPPTGPAKNDNLVEVPYPPPPAHVEVVPPQKDSLAVWLDGRWEWTGDAWRWADGEWATPPANAYYTRWRTVRRNDGQLLFGRATWRDATGKPIGAPGGDSCPVPVRVAAQVAKQ